MMETWRRPYKPLMDALQRYIDEPRTLHAILTYYYKALQDVEWTLTYNDGLPVGLYERRVGHNRTLDRESARLWESHLVLRTFDITLGRLHAPHDVNHQELWAYLADQWPRYRLPRARESATYYSHRRKRNFQANSGKMFLLLCTQQHLKATRTQWARLEYLIAYQPQLADPPTNYLQQVRESVPGGMYELNKMMALSLDDDDRVQVLKIFFQIGVNIVDIWVSFREPSLWVYRSGLAQTIKSIQSELRGPLSVISAEAKRNICKINIRGVWAFVWNEVRRLSQAEHTHPSDLGWRIYATIIKAATVPSEGPDGRSKHVIRRRCQVQPDKVPWFRPDGFWGHMGFLFFLHGFGPSGRSRGDKIILDGAEAQFFDLEAELARPAKSPRRVDTRQSATQSRAHVAMHSLLLEMPTHNGECAVCMDSLCCPQKRAVSLLCCDHEFHDECIGGWIRSSSAMSNTCPQCRKVIC
ncbi:uncharacterized protein EI97DRAFT_440396 [Westerdykella ornata]|uniref:RING-type domain-containing protein n=1 Tax=Westerdykella ornata TaxID=318751 RepID=A0A6A6JSP6_WESOR|nr:uncharacterized protein EI97DRAFT_440396 [Westerdykella ornata]KAF2278888.1 hypothetical protein EI97DRAFT_440396 [Westerdykella ornata]